MRDVVLAQAGHAQHVEHQHAVVGDDRPAALGEDRRMRHLGVVADALDVEDDVVGVFLERVVDARLEVGLRAVVVDAQAAADVEVLQPGPVRGPGRRRSGPPRSARRLMWRMLVIWLPRWKWSSLKQSSMPCGLQLGQGAEDLAHR